MLTFEDWVLLAREGSWTMLPYAVKMNAEDPLPDHWSAAWEEAHPYSCVLESGKGGRYTFLGLTPVSVIRGKGNSARIYDLKREQAEVVRIEGKPLELLGNWLAPYKSPSIKELPFFCGGAVGFLGYDVARSLESLPQLAEDDLKLDDYSWMRFEELWVVDAMQGDIYAVVHCSIAGMEEGIENLREKYDLAGRTAARMLEQWQKFSRVQSSNSKRNPSSTLESIPEPTAHSVSFSQEGFERAVEKVQKYISAGDVFQVNLSLRQAFPLAALSEQIYEDLRQINPSPYMGFMRFPDFQLVSASPELLIKLDQGVMRTRPIAGTRRRGLTEEEDLKMEEELRTNEKEQAEHIMLVDLLRNDLGRVAEFGSVRVSELFTIERYSHVMHLVSEVEGRLPEDKTAMDAIAAVFPGGTITGAPKIRTMEIIEELEPVTRGPYTGAMGWIDYNGNMELNIIIRTLVVKDGFGYIQAGAGIVIDSSPYREYRECHNKAKAIAMALGRSEQDGCQGGKKGDEGNDTGHR
jgi:para-aminobenzoate synthetase component 1